MYYIVNKETKEHRVFQGVKKPGWELANADYQGWIKWEGGGCPVPYGSKVDIEHRDHDLFFGVTAINSSRDEEWEHDDRIRDIIAYRPACYHKQGDQEEEEWNGEGLPPVGASVRVSVPMTGVECNADVVGHHCGKAVVWMHSDMTYMGMSVDYLSPIRTPEQRAIEAMEDELRETGVASRVRMVHANSIYTAIRAGRIPGVKLEDKS